MKRRRFLQTASTAATLSALSERVSGLEPSSRWRPKYILSSCMYGYQEITDILPEVQKTGATAIDIWPKPHGDQREQVTEIGAENFARLLDQHETKLGCVTQYKLGPFGLKDEMSFASRLGCHTIVTGARGPKGLSGAELKPAISQFVDQMRPHLDVAKQTDVTIAIENHGNSLIESPDSIRWLLELCDDKCLAIALAPYHLPQDPQRLAKLIHDCGDRLAIFYAWQHGNGCMDKLPKQEELLQMPGRGDLDFGPAMHAMKEINYQGWVSIFMHPVPRGVPILDTTALVTKEINRARRYLDSTY